MNNDILLIYQIIAETLEAKLETVLSTYNFEIAVQIGDVKYQPRQGKIRKANKPIINGILIARPTELVPVKDYDSYELDCILSIAPSAPVSKAAFDSLLYIAKDNSGEIIEIRDENEVLTTGILLTFNTPYMVPTDIKSGAGVSPEIRLAISALVYGKAVVSNQIHFEICVDPSAVTPTYERLQILTGAVSNVATQELQNVANNEQATAIKTSQTVSSNLRVIYQDTAALKQIVSDIFNAPLDKTYKMRYYDDVAILSTSPVVFDILASQISLNLAAGTIATLDFNLTRA